jgi:hypothetical protein
MEKMKEKINKHLYNVSEFLRHPVADNYFYTSEKNEIENAHDFLKIELQKLIRDKKYGENYEVSQDKIDKLFNCLDKIYQKISTEEWTEFYKNFILSFLELFDIWNEWKKTKKIPYMTGQIRGLINHRRSIKDTIELIKKLKQKPLNLDKNPTINLSESFLATIKGKYRK